LNSKRCRQFQRTGASMNKQQGSIPKFYRSLDHPTGIYSSDRHWGPRSGGCMRADDWRCPGQGLDPRAFFWRLVTEDIEQAIGGWKQQSGLTCARAVHAKGIFHSLSASQQRQRDLTWSGEQPSDVNEGRGVLNASNQTRKVKLSIYCSTW
jgi:hypothetical protein